MRDTDETQLELDPDGLAWSCPDGWLTFGTTDELESCDEDLGQARAVDALKLALRITGRGYNVYVAGVSGTGRTRVARRILEEEAAKGPAPDDICYVNNFAEPSAPRLLRLPPGKGRALRASLEAAAEKVRDGLAALRSSPPHRETREQVSQRFRAARAELVSSFESQVESEGFKLVELDLGAYRQHVLAALVEGSPVSMDDLDNLAHEGKLEPEALRRFQERHPSLTARLSETTSRARSIGRDMQKKLADADRQAARPLIEETMEEIRAGLGIPAGARPPLDAYLDEVEDYVVEIVPFLFSTGERLPVLEQPDAVMPDPLAALRVAVLVDRSGETGRPIVEETNPDMARLFGHVETMRGPDGTLHADLSGIRAGALLRADGGFLLLNAQDLVAQEGSWAGLRRALRTDTVSLFLGGRGDGPPPLVPEAVPVELTVVLVGSPGLRADLADQDPDFTKMFKVVALFDEHVPLTRDHVHSYACFLSQVIREEGLLHHDADAVSRNLELLVRAAGGRGKLSTNFRLFTDIARESTFLARQEGASVVTRKHVHEAIEGRSRRSALLSQRILEAFHDGVLQIEISGEKVGQVNGLAVVQTNLGKVGYPVRITATAAVGRAGIIDIEREAELSGEIHTKASLILAGFLRSQ
ncbi:MAG: AAA family ATPase, partial [Acidobacteriota bacterium]|nr:AAA family ATPase [Acidobacteriota bacterium]